MKTSMMPAMKILTTLRSFLSATPTRARNRHARGLERAADIELLESRSLLSASFPKLSIADISVVEGESGERTGVVTVSLSSPSLLPVTARYATRNRTALVGSDYLATSGTVTISPGQTSSSFSVIVVGDTLDENNESFEVVLAAPTNATVSKAIGVVTIPDDDSPPAITVSDNLVLEGTAASVVVSLRGVSSLPVRFTYSTSDITASSLTDYFSVLRTVTISPGARSAILSLPTRHDILDEHDERFLVTLSAPSNATLATPSAVITIQDNDPPAISIDDVSVVEGSDAISFVRMSVSLSSPSQLPVTVSYATGDWTALGAKDYQRGTGVLTIPAGARSAELRFSVLPDFQYEPEEAFAVLLSTPVNATLLKAIGTVTILDDDPPPVASVESKIVAEGNSGTQATTIMVSLNQSSSLPVTVRYQTKAITAFAGADFVGATGVLTIPPGALSGTFTVSVAGDMLDEDDETFTVELLSPVNATISSVPNVITILDNDLPPLVTISNATVAEGQAGSATSSILVSLSGASGFPISMSFGLKAITASAGIDFRFTEGTLTIPAGQTSGSISFEIQGDLLDEPNEAFQVNLFALKNARFSKSTAIVTIADDDGTQLPLFDRTRDFRYVGAFRVPTGIVGSDTFEYGGNALAFNAANRSLFMASNFDNGLNIAEVQIPATLSSTGVASSMTVANVLQPFVDLSMLLTTNAGGASTAPVLSYENLVLGGLFVAGNGLTGGMFMGYNLAEPESSTHSHFRTSGLNLASLSASSFTGLIDIRRNADSASGRVRGGYMTAVPDQWKDWIGANYVTGAAGQNRIQYSSSGPALFGFDAINPSGSSDKPLVYYPFGHALQWADTDITTPQLLFNGTTTIDGVAFVPGTRSVIFIGSNGVSSIGYGVGSRFNDRFRPYQGYHSQNGNYRYQIWAYDIDDFMSVRNGTLASWDIKPTSVVNFDLPTPEFSKYLGGTAFDPATGRLYISQKSAGPDATPIIHVYQLGAMPTSGFLAARATAAPATFAAGTRVTTKSSHATSTPDRITLTNRGTIDSLTTKQSIKKQPRLNKSATSASGNRPTKSSATAPMQETRQLDYFFQSIDEAGVAIF